LPTSLPTTTPTAAPTTAVSIASALEQPSPPDLMKQVNFGDAPQIHSSLLELSITTFLLFIVV
jgi:hypothetical protein